MKENIDIEKLFQDKFENFEAPVDTKIWSSVSEVIGGGAKVVKTGLSLITKIGIAVSLTVITGIVLYNTLPNNESQELSIVENNLNDNQNTIITKLDESKIISVNHTNDQEIIDNIVEIENQLIKEQKSFENDKKQISNQKKIVAELELNQKIIIDPVPVDLSEILNENAPNKVVINENVATNIENEVATIIENNPQELVSDNNDEIIVSTIDDKEELSLQSSIDLYPNVFTPNGDGANEYFIIKSTNLESMYILIQDKNYNNIFKSDKVDFKWDGTDLYGDNVVKGFYYYTTVAVGLDGKVYKNSAILEIR